MQPMQLEKGTKEYIHVLALAKELSSYGLGVFVPHAHDKDGAITQLEQGVIALEQNLHVGFVSTANVPPSAIPVGWRWDGAALEVCAACCDDGDWDGGDGPYLSALPQRF